MGLGVLVDKIQEVFGFLERLWSWAPILWKDRDWDYGFLLAMIYHKLGRMEKNMSQSAITDDHKRVAKQIKYAQFLIQLSQDGMMHPKVRKLWVEFETKYPNWPEDLFFKGFAARDSEQAHLWNEWVNANDAMEKTAKKRLYRHLETYMQGWWN